MLYNILQEFNKDEFPLKTDVLCYHCCHQFDTFPLSLPFSIKNNKFMVKYVFCSWECMKTFNSELNGSNENFIYSLIQQLYQNINGNTAIINFAPPKCMLKSFGGHLDINEFRKNNMKVKYTLVNIPYICSNPSVEKTNNYSWINEDTATQNYETSKLDDTEKSKTLSRPIQSKKPTSLANSMGLLRVN